MVAMTAMKATPFVAKPITQACNRRAPLACRAQLREDIVSYMSKKAAAVSLVSSPPQCRTLHHALQVSLLSPCPAVLQAAAAALLVATPLSAVANEFDLLANGTPDTYIVDDASVLNKTTKKSVGDALRELETSSGYRVEVATVRKLEFESDAFAFGDKLVSKWFPGATDKRGVLLVVTSTKDGALTGGDTFMKAVGDDLIDSVVGDNISILTEEEKYNEAVKSSVDRVVAKLTGKADPGAPERAERVRKRTYKTKAETEATKPATATIVLVLLGISFVVPMLQYFGEWLHGSS